MARSSRSIPLIPNIPNTTSPRHQPNLFSEYFYNQNQRIYNDDIHERESEVMNRSLSRNNSNSTAASSMHNFDSSQRRPNAIQANENLQSFKILHRDIQELKREFRSNNDEMYQKFDQRLKIMSKQHDQKLQITSRKFNQELQITSRKFNQELKNLSDKYDLKLRDMSDNFHKSISEISHEFKQIIEKKQQKFNSRLQKISDTLISKIAELQVKIRVQQRANSSSLQFSSLKQSSLLKKYFDPQGKTMINSCKYVEELGEGSVGNVCLVRHTKTNILYALKIIPASKYLNYKFQLDKKLPNQIQALKELDDERIMKFIEASQNEQSDLLMLLEFGGKDTLRSRIKSGLSMMDRLNIFHDIVIAVAHIHQKKIIHRDLKPQNIAINEKNQIKIIDFGQCQFLGPNSGRISKHGSPVYMAPQILKGEQYNQKVDIWSLGIILFQLVFGKLPFGFTEQTTEKECLKASNHQILLYNTKKPMINIVSPILKSSIVKNKQIRQSAHQILSKCLRAKKKLSQLLEKVEKIE